MTTQPQLSLPAQARTLDRIAIVGAGRMGTALAGALSAAAIDVHGPFRRGETPADDAPLVLLCVPDGQIEPAAATASPCAKAGSSATARPPPRSPRSATTRPSRCIRS